MPSLASRRGKANRRRGHDYEREKAAFLRRWDPTAQRKLEYQKPQIPEDLKAKWLKKRAGIDIETKLPLGIQCKYGANANPFEAINEAERYIYLKYGNDQGAPMPIAFTKKPGNGELVSMRPEDWEVLFNCCMVHPWTFRESAAGAKTVGAK